MKLSEVSMPLGGRSGLLVCFDFVEPKLCSFVQHNMWHKQRSISCAFKETSMDIEEVELDEAWYVQLPLTIGIACVKTLLGYSKKKQDELITFAKIPSSAYSKRRLWI
jgi:hypothetical protein